MSGKDLNDRLEKITERLDVLIRRLENLTRILMENPEYVELALFTRLFSLSMKAYNEPLKILSRIRAAERILKDAAIRRDEISRCIIQALALRGPLNISAITREVRAMRGKASRRIIRDRLKILRDRGIVKSVEGFGKKFDLQMK
ncbi:hypothetical protein DRO37_05795 [Candidatus Bathyarchaeota archaeon]|nr:MAG: hypothetical protein DRO37_05795 [Candidatus Bathyarchaeota archaeon]